MPTPLFIKTLMIPKDMIGERHGRKYSGAVS